MKRFRGYLPGDAFPGLGGLLIDPAQRAAQRTSRLLVESLRLMALGESDKRAK
jgi:hypothetical protein